MWAGGAIFKTGESFGSEATETSADTVAGDAHGFGDGCLCLFRLMSSDNEESTVSGGACVTMGLENLRWCGAVCQQLHTPPGGPQSVNLLSMATTSWLMHPVTSGCISRSCENEKTLPCISTGDVRIVCRPKPSHRLRRVDVGRTIRFLQCLSFPASSTRFQSVSAAMRNPWLRPSDYLFNQSHPVPIAAPGCAEP